MNRIVAIVAVALAWVMPALAVDLVTETFNTNGEGSRFTSSAYTDGGSDFFQRTDLNPHPQHSAGGFTGFTFTPPQGNGYWASEDIEDAIDNPLNDHGIVRLNDVAVTGFNQLKVHVYLAQTDDRFDLQDKIEIQYAFDANGGGTDLTAGTYTTVGRFIGNTVDIFGDAALTQDANLNGTAADDGGSPTLNRTMTEYTFDIPEVGGQLSVQIRIEQNGGTEELGFDHLRISGEIAATDPPVLANMEGTSLPYTEGDPATAVTATLTAADPDSANLTGATIQITGNNVPTEDLLEVVGSLPPGISTSAYVAATGTLALNGTASVASYQAALRQIAYRNTNTTNPSAATRTVRFQVTDESPNNSNFQSRDVAVTGTIGSGTIPHLEDLDTDGNGVRYTANSYLDGSDLFQRTDSNPHPQHSNPFIFTPPQGAGYWACEDISSAGNPLGATAPGILRVYDLDATGMNNLQVHVYLAHLDNTFDLDDVLEVQVAFDVDRGGSDLAAGSYTTIGRFIGDTPDIFSDGVMRQDLNLNGTLADDAGSPVLTGTMTEYTFDVSGTGNDLSVQIRVAQNGGSEELAFDHIRITGTFAGTDSPVLAAIEGGALLYTEGDPAAQITATLTATDTDSINLTSATIQIIGNNVPSEDVLEVVGSLPPGISTSAYVAATGTLVLNGTASVASYQAALRQVAYRNTNATNPSTATRTVRFQVTDESPNDSNVQSRNIDVIGTIGSGTIPHLEDFDTDGDGVRYTANSYIDGSDLFQRTDSNPHPQHSNPFIFTAPQGAGYWACEDVSSAGNPLGAAAPGILRVYDLDAVGVNFLEVHLYIAHLNGTFDLEDILEVQYAFDGNRGGMDLTAGSYTTIGRFIGDTPDIFSDGVMRQDLNLNGSLADDAASPVLTSTMTRYTFSIPATGNDLSVQVRFAQNGGTEELGFDHLEVTGIVGGPRVIDSSLQDGDSLAMAGSSLSYTARFDRVLDAFSGLGSEDVQLTGTLTGLLPPAGFLYDAGSSNLVVNFAPLPEGLYTLKLVSGDGAFEADTGEDLDGDPIAFPIPPNQSGDGIPGGDFELSFTVPDSVTTAFPTPFEAKAPLGSLVYDPLTVGEIVPVGDQDSFTLDLDAGQTITVVVDPMTTLHPGVELRDPSFNVIGSASASAPGTDAVIQTVPVSVAGQYTITVSGFSPGAYALAVTLNAAVESEAHDGVANDTLGTAQDLDGGFAPLPLGAGDRTAVLGEVRIGVTAPSFVEDFNAGPGGFTFDNGFGSGNGLWHASTGRSLDGLPGHSSPGSIYYGQGENAFGNGNYETGAANGGAATSSPIAIPASPSSSLVFNHLKDGEGGIYDVATVAVDAGSGFVTLASSSAGSLPGNTGGDWHSASVDLSAFAGSNITLRFSFDTGDGILNATEGWFVDDVAIGTPTPTIDVYSFSLGVGQSVSLVLDSLVPAGGGRTLELLDGTGTLLATGSFLGNADQIIADFVAPLAGTFYARVDGTSGAYNLMVTRGVSFEREFNDAPGTGSDLAQTGKALGHLHEFGDVDGFAVSVNAGDNLVLDTATPADGPFEFVNDLDPHLRLLDPLGDDVASDDNSAGDGRNASLTHGAALTGSYRVEVTDAGVTGGEYVLRVAGASGSATPFEVISSDPSDGQLFNVFPTQATISFNSAVLLPSLDASDLVVGGLPALSLTVIDGTSIQFEIDPAAAAGDGTYAMFIAGGAMLNLGGQPLSPFAASFTLDGTAPRVIASSIQEGDLLGISGGMLAYTAQFDEELIGAFLDPGDVSLVGSLSGLIVPDTFAYDPTNSVLTVSYSGLGEEAFTLSLDDGQFLDLAFNPLDGEPLAFPLPPNVSGDGFPGGDFVVNFTTDVITNAFPLPLTAKPPLGSLVYDPTLSGIIGTPGDVDHYTIALNAGQTLTVVADPAGGLWPSIEVTNPDGAFLAGLSSPGADLDVVIQTLFVAAPGTYTISVFGNASTTGPYDLDLILNASAELEAHDGATNDTPATAQDITASFIVLKDFGGVFGGMGGLISSESNDTLAGALTPGMGPGPATFTDSGEIGDYLGGLDVDLIAIELQVGSRVTIDIDAHEFGSSLDSYLRVFDPSGTQVGSIDDAPAPGEPFTLDSYLDFTAASSGTHYVGISGLANTSYDPTVEGSGSAGSEGPYDVAITILGVEILRGAVLGELPAALGPDLRDDFETGVLDGQWTTSSSDPAGRIRLTNEVGTAAGDFAMIMDRDPSGATTLNEAIWTVDLTGLAAPNLVFSHAEWGDEDALLPADFVGSVNGDGVAISDDGVNWHTVVNSPNQLTGQWQTYTVDLATEAAAAGMSLGANFQVKFQQFDNFPVTTDGRGYDEIRILDGLPIDHYSFTLASNDVVSLGVSPTSGGDFAGVTLFDAAGSNLLATGFAANGPNSVIADFAAPSNGIYLARVSGGGTYNLVILKNAGIDTEENSTLGGMQDISPTGFMLGFAEASASTGDIYRVAVNPGDAMLVSTETPLDGPLEFGNGLDPQLELFNPGGTLVATDTSTAPDGKNAVLAALAAVGGNYGVRVVGESGTTGEYLVNLVVIDGTLDSDGDNLPDAWEIVNGLDPHDDGTFNPDNGADGDPDGDGSNNLHELQSMTHPHNPDSVFKVTDLLEQDAPSLREITFNTVPGKVYFIEYNDVTAHPPGFTWQPFADTSNGVGAWVGTGTVEDAHTFIDDFSPATSGGPPAGGFRLYRVSQGLPPVPPLSISMLIDSNFVDQAEGIPSQEPDNVKASLEAIGHTVNTFTGVTAAAFGAATAGADILVIPELEVGDLAAVLDPAAAVVISNYVAGGGSLVVHGQADGHDEDLVNLVFGFSLVSGSFAASFDRTAAASGTPFEFGPAAVPENNGTYAWDKASLSGSGGTSLYESGASVGVARISFGAGQITFLAWDWFDALPLGIQDDGWLVLLRLATQQE